MNLKIDFSSHPLLPLIYQEDAYPKTKLKPERLLPNPNIIIKKRMKEIVLVKIKSSKIDIFIEKIIEKLSQKNHRSEIQKLKTIQQLLLSKSFKTKVLQLAVLDEKNPIIKILSSLTCSTIQDLASIELPELYQNFFEELEFYAKIDRIESLQTPLNSIQSHCEFAEELYRARKNIKAAKVLNLTTKTLHEKPLTFLEKFKFFKNIANIFAKQGDENSAVEILGNICPYVEQFPSFQKQLKTLRILAKDCICYKNLDAALEIMNRILEVPHFSSQEKTHVIQNIFIRYINNKHSISYALKKLDNHPEKDMIIQSIVLNLLKNTDNISFATKITETIKSEEIKNSIKKNYIQNPNT